MKKIKIDLGSINVPIEISNAIKKAGIETYVYVFKDNEDRTIKFGTQYSPPKPSKTHGERVYRQAWHIDGWPVPPLSANGSEMQDIAKKYAKRYNKPLDRKNVSIVIFDQTDSTLSSKAMRKKCEDLERDYVKRYVEVHYRAPVGNMEPSTKRQVKNQVVNDKIAEIFS